MNPFLISYLPPLTFRQPPPVRFAEFLILCEGNLAKKQMREVNRFRSFIDLENLSRKYFHEPIDPRGKLTELALEEELKTFPEADVLRMINNRQVAFQREATGGFLGRYFRFEWELKVCLTIIRAKQLNRSLEKELSNDDQADLFVHTLHGDALPFEFAQLGELPSDPILAKKTVDRFRFEAIEEMTARSNFSLDQVLAYAAKLKILEDFEDLSQEKGRELIYDNICNW
ncbi:MAG: hypothetical protein SP1CHLAM54_04640 [Chlamydiia bacterium]|nr:hypothetical protein [Chlamydiia bacterium]MCH9615376.1 hypothetical protein [Chlamydiia bacterium]MCH9628302.1 hypothetical protein [Chlamydiia bacterium]